MNEDFGSPQNSEESSQEIPVDISDDMLEIEEPPVDISDDMLETSKKGDVRLNFEQGMSYFPILTIALITANVIVFFWQIASGSLTSQETIIASGALSRNEVLEGEIWRLVSAMFLHGSFEHLLGNCLILYIVGMACEHALGIKQAVAVYFVSGLCGSLLSIIIQPGPSVGASGAIFGVIGSVIVFLYKYQKFFIVRDRRTGFVFIAWTVYSVITGLATPLIDNAAHIGGLLGGSTVTLLLTPTLFKNVD